MGSQTLHTCPICGEPMFIAGDHAKKFKDRFGFVLTVGYSVGGWGHRQNHINFSDEICLDCYTALGEMLTPAIEFIQRSGLRQGDPVQPVQRTQLPSKRRFGALLRFLSPDHRQEN